MSHTKINCEKYDWYQTFDLVTIEVFLRNFETKMSIKMSPKINCEPKYLRIDLGNDDVIEGELNALVYPDEMLWYFYKCDENDENDKKLIIELSKVNTYKHESIWKKIFVNEPNHKNDSEIIVDVPISELDQQTKMELEKEFAQCM